jgi:multiple antibiotic resistance protein
MWVMVYEDVSFFVYAFVSVFVIVNPISGLVTFISLTEGMSVEERHLVARRSVVVACVLAVVFALFGEVILRFFGITVDSLRVAGGVLLFLVAIDMLHAKISRESITSEEIRSAVSKEDVSVVPLAMPLLTGPGTITTVIIIIKTGTTLELKGIALLAIIVTFALSYLIFRLSEPLDRILGVSGEMVLTRVMGLLLGAIAVNFIATGIWNIYLSMA